MWHTHIHILIFFHTVDQWSIDQAIIAVRYLSIARGASHQKQRFLFFYETLEFSLLLFKNIIQSYLG